MTIPLSALWLDADAVGRMLSLSGRVVRERIALRPDFPSLISTSHFAPRFLNVAILPSGSRPAYRPTKNNPAIAIPTSTAHARSNTFGARARTSRRRSMAFIDAARRRDAAAATRRACRDSPR